MPPIVGRQRARELPEPRESGSLGWIGPWFERLIQRAATSANLAGAGFPPLPRPRRQVRSSTISGR